MAVADEKRTLAQQAKAALYRLVAARTGGRDYGESRSAEAGEPDRRIIFAQTQAVGYRTGLCSDAVFIRRAYLDLTGKLPPAEEARAFIQDPDPGKRAP
jgi:hypothetical protein